MVADALGVSVAGSASDPEDALVGHLATRDLLVLLDNCEHLIEAVASFAETVLGRCAGVRILATSREALAVPGEIQLPVAPLAVPDELTLAGRVPEFAAARLFLDRAAAAMPELEFDDAALRAVGLICQRRTVSRWRWSWRRPAWRACRRWSWRTGCTTGSRR